MVSHPELFKNVSKALGITYIHLKNTVYLQKGAEMLLSVRLGAQWRKDVSLI